MDLALLSNEPYNLSIMSNTQASDEQGAQKEEDEDEEKSDIYSIVYI